jgi:hypothetical protein
VYSVDNLPFGLGGCCFVEMAGKNKGTCEKGERMEKMKL